MARWAQSMALGALGASLIVAGLALARGPDLSIPTFGPSGGAGFFNPEPSRSTHISLPGEDDAAPVRRKRASSGAKRSGYRFTGNAVCVKLCDGSFFPASVASAGDAGCASQCPEAPTELYAMTSDRIEDAVSARTGTPYAKLPVARRFEAQHEATCACHRDAVASHAKELLHDNTLRKGDVVMTAEGFRVFEGGGWGPTTPQDFVLVSKAGVPKSELQELTAMEHASGGSAPVSAPTLLAAKPKGNVTVDNGTP